MVPRVAAAAAIAAAIVAIVLTLVVTGRLGSDNENAPESGGQELPEGFYLSPAPRIELDDFTGQRFDSRSLLGSPYLVTFLYTRCRDVCPLIGQDIRDSLRALESDSDEVNAVAVSVDPRGDTPRRVADWIRDQDLPENFHYLTGTEKQLRPVWERWFTVSAGETKINPKTHASSVWVVDSQNRLRSRYSGSAGIDTDALSAELRDLNDQAG